MYGHERYGISGSLGFVHKSFVDGLKVLGLIQGVTKAVPMVLLGAAKSASSAFEVCAQANIKVVYIICNFEIIQKFPGGQEHTEPSLYTSMVRTFTSERSWNIRVP